MFHSLKGLTLPHQDFSQAFGVRDCYNDINNNIIIIFLVFRNILLWNCVCYKVEMCTPIPNFNLIESGLALCHL